MRRRSDGLTSPPRDVTISSATASQRPTNTVRTTTFLRAQISDHRHHSHLFDSECKQQGDSGVDLALELGRDMSSRTRDSLMAPPMMAAMAPSESRSRFSDSEASYFCSTCGVVAAELHNTAAELWKWRGHHKSDCSWLHHL